GLTAKGFLIRERDRMLKKMRPQMRRIRRYLYGLSHGKKKKSFPIRSLYDPKLVVSRIKKFGRITIQRIGIFTNYYKMIIFISRILRLLHLGLFAYILYGLLKTNGIFPFS